MSIQDEAVIALRANRGPMSTGEVAKAIGRGEASVREALTRAERSKAVRADRTGRAVVWSLPRKPMKSKKSTTKRKGGRMPTRTKTRTAKRGSHIKPGHSAGVPRLGTPGDRTACAARDEKVRALLARHPAGLSRREVAAKLDMELPLAYNSLARLQRAGEATKTRDGSRVPRWTAT